MTRKITAWVLVILVLSSLLPVQAAVLPSPYRDGCSAGVSWFYRNILKKVPRWEACCDAHDKLYKPGGTSNQRAAADRALYKCMATLDSPFAAALFWIVVRLGGTPFFPYVWGAPGADKDYGVLWGYSKHEANKGW